MQLCLRPLQCPGLCTLPGFHLPMTVHSTSPCLSAPLALASGFFFVFPKVIHCSFSYSNGTLFYPSFFLYFVLGYSQFTNNVVIVPGGQQRDSAIHTHVSVLFQTPLPSRLPHNIEQSSMCYTIDPSSLSILKIAICFYPDSYSLEWGEDFNADTSPSASSTYLSDCSFLWTIRCWILSFDLFFKYIKRNIIPSSICSILVPVL